MAMGVSKSTQDLELNFALVTGSPILRFLGEKGVWKGRGRRPYIQAITLASVAWIPLFILSVIGYYSGFESMFPFWSDFTVHVRFLVALPVLVIAEIFINRRLRIVVAHLFESGLIEKSDVSKLDATVAETDRLLDSIWAEALILAIIVCNLIVSLESGTGWSTITWRFGMGSIGFDYSPIKLWFSCVSAPIFQFILLRWLWLLLVWSRFLWKLSKFDLRLAGTHPDRLGGLGFVSDGQMSFGYVIFAMSSVISAHIATLVVFHGASLFDFNKIVLIYILVSILIFMAPLLVFSPQLAREKRNTLAAFGMLGLDYAQSFQKKWFGIPRNETSGLLGSPDLQSLADLGGSFDVARNMQIVLLVRKVIFVLASVALAPFFPLVLTLFSLPDVFKAIFRILA